MKQLCTRLIVTFVVGILIQPVLAQPDHRLGLTLEGGLLWQSRNDIRVPNATGTLFSLPDVIGNEPQGLFRAEANLQVAEKHGFRLVFAPIRIAGTGELPGTVSFAGVDFNSAPVHGTYKFNSYRLTYHYRFYDGRTWSWRIGATGFIRDAKIALSQNRTYAEDTDVGVVPLVYLQGLAKLGEDWAFRFDFDGLAAPQGRAFDIALKLGYSVSDHLGFEFGYRTVEGGADVEQVYNFAWLNSITGAIRLDF
jgi:hypothetical protein